MRKAPGELDPNKIVKSADSISNKYKQDREWRDKANPYDMLEREWSEENPQISKMLALAVGNTFKISNKKQFVGTFFHFLSIPNFPIWSISQRKRFLTFWYSSSPIAICNLKSSIGGLCDTIEPLEAVAQEPETNAYDFKNNCNYR